MSRKSTRELDLEARNEAKTGANKRKFSSRDLCDLRPKTQAQKELITLWHEDKCMLVTGSAGTGKTALCLWLSLRDVFEDNYDKLVIVRSIVPSREIGFTPGTVEEKVQMYETPYIALCDEIFPYAKTYLNLKKNGYIEFESTSFLRGRTFNNSIILVDEIQNFSWQELHTTMTRLGEGSKIVFIGDTRQVDLNKRNDRSGYEEFVKVVQRMDPFEQVEFLPQDVVCSGVVKEYLMLLEQ